LQEKVVQCFEENTRISSNSGDVAKQCVGGINDGTHKWVTGADGARHKGCLTEACSEHVVQYLEKDLGSLFELFQQV
jgi:hypothetical protein